MAGSALLGAVLALARRRPTAQVLLRDGAGLGFCGGLTTFSTFAVEIARFLHDDRLALGITYASASVAACVVAVWIGAVATR